MKDIKLKVKTLLVVGASMFLFLTILLVIFRPFLLEDSNKLDDSNIKKDLEGIKNQLNSEMDNLNRINRDWAVWDDTYLFLNNKYPNYPMVNLHNDTFNNLRINFIVYIDKHHEVVLQKGYNFQNGEQIELESNFYEEFLPIIHSSDKINDPQLVLTKYGLIITTAQSVFKSNGDGPSVGTLVMGKMIDDSFIKDMGKKLSSPISFNQVKKKSYHSAFKIKSFSKTKIKGSYFIQDYSKKTTFEISVVNDRDFYLQKKVIIKQLYTQSLLVSMFFIIFIIVILNNFVLSRIRKLSMQLIKIQNNKDIKSRITISKGHKDELTNLEHSINRMLSSLEEKHNAILKLAYYDQLTLLPNRYLLYKEFEKSISKIKGELAVLFFDLDGFKLVNDSLGHDVGDDLLNMVCNRVSPIVKKENGVMARFGGDEFVILLKDKERVNLVNIIKEILVEVGKEYQLNPYKTYVTTSVGVSIYPQDGSTLTQLLQKADIAMYEAKKNGKNQYIFYQDLQNNSKYKEFLDLENDLKYALLKKQFEIYYQIIVNGRNKNIVEVEALLRWNHPTKGMISPAKFIPIAEETGLMPSIGIWVLEEAVKQVNKWHKMGFDDLILSINISKSQMKDNNFIEKLDQVLSEFQLPPSMLQVEITESDINHYLKEILQFTKELKMRNVKIALDDFGVGTSSLNYLKELPIDVLKIDQNFIKNIPTQSFDTILLSGILNVTKELNLEVIIEGIEKEEQVEFVTSRIDAKLQGYYFSKPLSSSQLEKNFLRLNGLVTIRN